MDLSKLSLAELKAMGYDTILLSQNKQNELNNLLQTTQNTLNQIGQAIAAKEAEANKEKEPCPKPID